MYFLNKINFALIIGIFVLIGCSENKKIKYPKTNKKAVIDTYFGNEIVDNYRWLEDDLSEETERWVEEQNETTFKYLERIPYRDKIKNRLIDLLDYEKVSAPFVEGEYTYFYKNSGLQDQSILYRNKENDEPEIFLDPNKFSKDGTTSLAGLSFSKDASLVAYSISEGGADWRKAIVMDVDSREIVGDTIQNIKFSAISWKGNEGFYYSSYEEPDGSVLSSKTEEHKLYFHKLGTKQKFDEVIYGSNPSEKNRYVRGYVTEDDRFLIIDAAIKTTGNKLFIKDLKNNSSLKTIIGDYKSNTSLLDNNGNELFLVTDYNASNKKIVKTSFINPGRDYWTDLVPEKEFVLSASKCGGFIFTRYMIDAISKVYQYDFNGKLIREVELPGIGTSSGFRGKKNENELYFNFSNYYIPSTRYKYNVISGEYSEFWKPNIDFQSSNYISEQVFYNSKDGTEIPMIITYKKGTVLDGNNPTILYGYGGFNISQTPRFSITNAAWLELGGIYAVPNIRGGGEYGRNWHNAGIKTNKQNVFDDFIAAAEYLVKENYTSNNYLAIRGGSNGGLLVGAVMTQRPDLIRVALPAVGVLDMLRYHQFTSGAGWEYDYGTSETSNEMFKYLKSYSPVHNVKENTTYPSTLITTGDHDDRVVPAHSFKFAAELQEKGSKENPLLIRIEKNAGHGAGTPISKTVEQYADIFGFTLFNMGYKKLPKK